MYEYETIFCKVLHAKLKERIRGGIYVRIEDDNCLWTDIIMKELNTITHIKIGKPFSDMILDGYSTDTACDEIIKEYRRAILKRCFK